MLSNRDARRCSSSRFVEGGGMSCGESNTINRRFSWEGIIVAWTAIVGACAVVYDEFEGTGLFDACNEGASSEAW